MVKNKITLNVLADISKKISRGGSPAPDNKILVLFTGSNVNLESRIKEIGNLKKDPIALSLGFSFMGENILDKKKIIGYLNPASLYGEEDIFNLERIMEENLILLMPNITISTLAKVATGMIDSFASTILWTYLYSGKTVYLDFNSIRNYLGEGTKNKVIENLIEKHIKTIKEMGALEVEEGKYIGTIGINNELVQGDSNIDLLKDSKFLESGEKKRILTERDLSRITRDTVIKLPKGSIITPLAKDRAREKGIQIRIKE